MKKIISLLLVLLLALTSAFAVNAEGKKDIFGSQTARGEIASDSYGYLYWVLDDDGTLTISGDGSMNDFYSFSLLQVPVRCR